MKTRTWQEMGITQDDLYKREAAMPYWLQYENKEFLQDMINALRMRPRAIENWVRLLYEDKNISDIVLSNGSAEISAKYIYEALLREVGKLNDILGVMWEYSKNMKTEESGGE